MKSWGCRTDGFCKRCTNVPETIDHVFLQCPVAKETWIYFKTILRSLGSEKFNINPSSALLHLLPQTCEKSCRPVLTYLIKLICYFIWKCCCELVYDHKEKSSFQITSKIFVEIRDRCLCAFNTTRIDSGLALKLLTTNNVLASLENNTLKIHV